MAEKFINRKDFISNLPRIYGTYTGGFLIFIILMAIAEQAGMTAKTIGILFVAFLDGSDIESPSFDLMILSKAALLTFSD